MELYDSHAHLTDEKFAGDLPAVLARMQEAGVTRCLVVGDAAQDPTDAFRLAERHDFLLASAGVHPHDASCWNADRAVLLKNWLQHPKCAALGEIGLDYHYDFSPREAQRAAYDAQLDLAYDLNLPVILHVREAHGDNSDMLRARFRAGRLPRGVMHCYGGSWESAKAYLAMGLYLSFSGSVTFKNAPNLWEVAKNAPLDRLLIETDCPYMAPVPLRGQRNEPAYVRHTAQRVADLRGIPLAELAAATCQNALDLFGAGQRES